MFDSKIYSKFNFSNVFNQNQIKLYIVKRSGIKKFVLLGLLCCLGKFVYTFNGLNLNYNDEIKNKMSCFYAYASDRVTFDGRRNISYTFFCCGHHRITK